MRIRTIVCTSLGVLVLGFADGCGSLRNEEFKLVRWPDGDNDRYAIEISRDKGSEVVIPDVRALQTTTRFISGNAYWKYMDGFYSTSDGTIMTNEFWFVLDKGKGYPTCYAIISTNRESWIAWCISHNAPTNIIEIKAFVVSRSSSGGGGMPTL